VESPPEGAVVQKVNWSDNPWFPDVLDYERRALHSRDIAAYNNIWEGIPRTQVDGAVFGKEMEFAELDGRITRVPYDPIKPVFTIWDLGFADSTSIWFVQFIGMEIRVIRYIEDNQKTISWYLAEIQKFGYMFDTHYLPHDAGSHSLGTGKSIEEIVRATGVKVQVLDRVPIVDSINAARIGVAHPMIGTNEMSRMDMIYTVCQMVLRAAILIPLATSERYCFIIKDDSFPSIMADVFSLKYEKIGAPIMSQMYLNKEK
jgi:hypothetical protein